MKIGGMSIADYTFAEVTEMSVHELRKSQTAGVQHRCMSLPRQWYGVSREFNASDARDKATMEGMSSIIFPAIARCRVEATMSEKRTGRGGVLAEHLLSTLLSACMPVCTLVLSQCRLTCVDTVMI